MPRYLAIDYFKTVSKCGDLYKFWQILLWAALAFTSVTIACFYRVPLPSIQHIGLRYGYKIRSMIRVSGWTVAYRVRVIGSWNGITGLILSSIHLDIAAYRPVWCFFLLCLVGHISHAGGHEPLDQGD